MLNIFQALVSVMGREDQVLTFVQLVFVRKERQETNEE